MERGHLTGRAGIRERRALSRLACVGVALGLFALHVFVPMHLGHHFGGEHVAHDHAHDHGAAHAHDHHGDRSNHVHHADGALGKDPMGCHTPHPAEDHRVDLSRPAPDDLDLRVAVQALAVVAAPAVVPPGSRSIRAVARRAPPAPPPPRAVAPRAPPLAV